ncbi:hypothetical protein PPL_02842 [Heterostelium album PN500]|uniref:Uncharacterized protein n=1 Tax=Heterostelium pallidum (strain ATCC 26659 / Pp 5 / PN500) TaxID=670386 RepID=D3B377_HETP5|nr:hypothetical protein PPL_02842 [Heterostelium album PN500]EFA83775.1 hypothetical protein PPL_02842 [Heterostelium album PN500]|eukprot:XP_020435892.1 hypothetical protein PPL_02842 [Heterostelium album PN500]
MLKYTILVLFVLVSVASSYLYVSQGQYVWQNQGQCSASPTLVNVTVTKNVVNSFSANYGYPFLVNVTVNPDYTFNGLGALYYPGTWTLNGYTTVKGQIISQYNLLVVYNPSTTPSFGGATLNYLLVQCNSGSSKSISEQQEEANLASIMSGADN